MNQFEEIAKNIQSHCECLGEPFIGNCAYCKSAQIVRGNN